MINLRSVFICKQPNYFKGIGPATIDQILSTVTADELLRLLSTRDANGLTQIPCVSDTTARGMLQGYVAYHPLVELAYYLDQNGFSKPIAPKVFQVWGSLAMEKIHSNPYRLLALADWHQVDALGLKRGPEFHPCRLVAAVEACMYKDYEENQNTFTDADCLFLSTMDLIGCNRAQFRQGLELAIATGAVIDVKGNLQVPAVNLLERHMEKFLRLNSSTEVSAEKVTHLLDCTGNYDQLTDEQRQAVVNALTNRFSVYYGRGGRGKTFTLKAIADGAERLLHKKIYLTAVAAKACRKMERETGRKAFTIAHLLHVTQKRDLQDSLIMIDEASMLSLINAFQILKKVPCTAGIVILGDPNQIPSFEAGTLLYDVVRTKAVPVQELTINKRQDEKTDRLLNDVLNGYFPRFDDFTPASGTGLFRLLASDIEDAEQKAVGLYLALKGSGEEVQIISPLAKHQGGSDSINAKVHYELYGQKDYVNGTPVVWTKNMSVQYGVQLTNGSMGYVKGATGTYLEVVFEMEGDVHLTWDEVANRLQMAYALTVHKAQGSDWENVIIVVPRSPRMVNRNMIYTALSRCKKRSIIIYHDHAFVSRQVAAPAAHEQRRSLLFSEV